MKILSKTFRRVLTMSVLAVAMAGSLRADEPGRGFQEPVRDVNPANVSGGEITSTLTAPAGQPSGGEAGDNGSEADHWRFRYHYHYYYYRPATVYYYYPVVYYRVTPFVVYADGVNGAKDGVAEKTADGLAK